MLSRCLWAVSHFSPYDWGHWSSGTLRCPHAHLLPLKLTKSQTLMNGCGGWFKSPSAQWGDLINDHQFRPITQLGKVTKRTAFSCSCQCFFVFFSLLRVSLPEPTSSRMAGKADSVKAQCHGWLSTPVWMYLCLDYTQTLMLAFPAYGRCVTAAVWDVRNQTSTHLYTCSEKRYISLSLHSLVTLTEIFWKASVESELLDHRVVTAVMVTEMIMRCRWHLRNPNNRNRKQPAANSKQ